MRPIVDGEEVLVPDISIHAPREGCDHAGNPVKGPALVISIHAPREGCDPRAEISNPFKFISIHAPREGCDRAGSMTADCA